MLRRTKLTKDIYGDRIINLTQRIVKIEKIDLSEGEREFYNALMEKSKRALLQANQKQKYMTAFALLLRMRQSCDHPFLVLGKKLVEETALKAEAGLLADDDNHN